MYVSSYSKVGAIEQRYMVNSGVRGKKDRNPRMRVEYLFIYPITYKYKYRVPVIYTTLTRGLRRRFGLIAGAPSGRCGHALAV
jgi:hypothetical protein